jgi:ribonuclease D
MDTEGLWIRDARELVRFLDEIDRGPLAIDVEADSFHHYREQVCLVQVSAAGRHHLIDPLAGVDLSDLGSVFSDVNVRKVFHGADYDLRLLERDHGLRVRGLFDTMIAARLTGERSFGLAALLQKEFGVRLDKSLQRADWSRRPLTAAMERYALEDTRHLEPLSRRLEQRLERLGRLDWAREEFERLETVRWRSEPSSDRPAHLRLKGARKLGPRGLAVLGSLYSWRDARARDRDVPPFRVARDADLVALAGEPPESLRKLSRMGALRRSLREGGLAEEILDAVRIGLQAPEEHAPGGDRQRVRPHLDEGRLKRFRRSRDRVANRLDLEPSLVCSRRVIEALAERVERGDDWAETPDLRRWQKDLLEPVVAEVWPSEPTL